MARTLVEELASRLRAAADGDFVQIPRGMIWKEVKEAEAMSRRAAFEPAPAWESMLIEDELKAIIAGQAVDNMRPLYPVGVIGACFRAVNEIRRLRKLVNIYKATVDVADYESAAAKKASTST
jgi:hypothetical protein